VFRQLCTQEDAVIARGLWTWRRTTPYRLRDDPAAALAGTNTETIDHAALVNQERIDVSEQGRSRLAPCDADHCVPSQTV
jgi:hypothetical protein